MSPSERRKMIRKQDVKLSLTRQCTLLVKLKYPILIK